MKTKTTASDRESPARRLKILYVASLCAVALLLVVSQAFILWEFSRQRATLRSIGRFVRHRSIDRPLGLSALAIQAADEPAVQRAHLESLRGAIAQTEADLLVTPSQADAHLRTAIRTAQALLLEIDRDRSGPPRVVDTGALVRTIVNEESAFRQEFSEAVIRTEAETIAQIARLELLELKLSGLVLVVLLLEGIFVIGPAIQKIRRFVAEMERSHEELSAYATRLERSNQELQDFASVASHDLQEPLRKVQAFSDRLKSKYAGILDEQGRDYLDRVQNAARRMQTLINDLLTYARVTTKALPFVPIDLTAATRDVVVDLEARIEQVGGQIELGDLPTVDADPMQVRQLMQNLIGNALKYHRAEQPPVVKIYSKPSEEGHKTPLNDLSGGRCEILVEDNGIGFDEIYKERIFTIFQRLHGRTEYEGTGVGLAVCRKIAERHGGTITARSTPGKGSTFLVSLPFRQPKETIPDGRASETDRDSDRRR